MVHDVLDWECSIYVMEILQEQERFVSLFVIISFCSSVFRYRERVLYIWTVEVNCATKGSHVTY